MKGDRMGRTLTDLRDVGRTRKAAQIPGLGTWTRGQVVSYIGPPRSLRSGKMLSFILYLLSLQGSWNMK